MLDRVGMPKPESRVDALSAPVVGRDAAAGDDRHGALVSIRAY